MRLILAVLLFVASSGMIFASYNADTRLPGIEYVQLTVQETCGAQSAHGDRLMDYLSNGGGELSESAYTPDKASSNLLRYLACGLIGS